MTMYAHPFCVYVTLWRGMFYIGSSSVKRVLAGYHGSVTSTELKEIWKWDLKERPDCFQTMIFKTYATREEAYEKEAYFQRKLDVLKKATMYANRSIANKEFFNAGGYKLSQKTRLKQSIAQLGNTSSKGRVISEKHRKGLSKPRSIQGKQNMSDSAKRRIADGTMTIPCGMKGRNHTEASLKKLREASKHMPTVKCEHCRKQLRVCHIKRHNCI